MSSCLQPRRLQHTRFPSLSLSPVNIQMLQDSLFSPLFKLVKVPLCDWMSFFIVKYHFFPVSDLCLWNHRNLTLHSTVFSCMPISVLPLPTKAPKSCPWLPVLLHISTNHHDVLSILSPKCFLTTFFLLCSHGSPPGLSLPPLLSPDMAF